LFSEEIFGPIFPLLKFKEESEAIRIANNSKYGLAGIIIGQNIENAEKIASEIDVGAIAINDIVVTDPRLPSGGIKDSGFGRELGINGAREFTNVKSIWIK